jgi:hypothetical protein
MTPIYVLAMGVSDLVFPHSTDDGRYRGNCEKDLKNTEATLISWSSLGSCISPNDGEIYEPLVPTAILRMLVRMN